MTDKNAWMFWSIPDFNITFFLVAQSLWKWNQNSLHSTEMWLKPWLSDALVHSSFWMSVNRNQLVTTTPLSNQLWLWSRYADATEPCGVNWYCTSELLLLCHCKALQTTSVLIFVQTRTDSTGPFKSMWTDSVRTVSVKLLCIYLFVCFFPQFSNNPPFLKLTT